MDFKKILCNDYAAKHALIIAKKGHISRTGYLKSQNISNGSNNLVLYCWSLLAKTYRHPKRQPSSRQPEIGLTIFLSDHHHAVVSEEAKVPRRLERPAVYQFGEFRSYSGALECQRWKLTRATIVGVTLVYKVSRPEWKQISPNKWDNSHLRLNARVSPRRSPILHQEWWGGLSKGGSSSEYIGLKRSRMMADQTA